MKSETRILVTLAGLVFSALGCDTSEPPAEDTTNSPAEGDESAEESDDDDSSGSQLDAGKTTSKVDAGKSVPIDAGKSAIKDAAKDPARADAGDAGEVTDASTGALDSAVAPGTPPQTGSFPAVAVKDLGSKGPYTAKTVNSVGPSRGYTLYYPEQAPPEGVLHPLVSWGNGGATTPVDYPMLPHLATHGFVVIASNNPIVAGPDIKGGIDWLVQQNDVADSPLYKKLDVKNVSGVGYSNGGLATLSVADDPRFTTIVIISGANVSADARTTNMPKLHTPIAYFCTDDDASEGNCKADYDVVKVPAFFGVMKGSEHVDVTEFLGIGDPVYIDLMHRATTGWLRWKQMSDLSLAPVYVGSDCGLCTDSKWAVQPQKNDLK